MKNNLVKAPSPIGLFERYLSVWVGIAIIAGVLLGNAMPQAFRALAGIEYAKVNLVVALLIWLMIFPMMVQIDFSRILILTGYASIPTTVQAIKLGADNYLAKPANTTSILSALQMLDLTEGKAIGPDTDNVEGVGYEPMSVRKLEWEHIQQVLAAHQGNISAAARAMNMHRRTLQRKLAKRPVAK